MYMELDNIFNKLLCMNVLTNLECFLIVYPMYIMYTKYATVKPRYKVPQYNGNLDIKEVFVSTEDW
jgi:hypothetical protein